MKTIISLCSEDIIRDADTNSISIHNIIEELNVESIPFIIPKLSLFYLFQKEKGDENKYETTLTLKIGEKELQTFKIPINFQGKERTRNTIKIGGLPISLPGYLTVELKHSNNTLSELSIPIINRKVLNVEQKNK